LAGLLRALTFVFVVLLGVAYQQFKVQKTTTSEPRLHPTPRGGVSFVIVFVFRGICFCWGSYRFADFSKYQVSGDPIASIIKSPEARELQ
jgi:hypothetical protein